jgi:hypothetical protein
VQCETAVFDPNVATFRSLMLPLFHLVVLFWRSLMNSSFVSQSPQLFPARNAEERISSGVRFATKVTTYD